MKKIKGMYSNGVFDCEYDGIILKSYYRQRADYCRLNNICEYENNTKSLSKSYYQQLADYYRLTRIKDMIDKAFPSFNDVQKRRLYRLMTNTTYGMCIPQRGRGGIFRFRYPSIIINDSAKIADPWMWQHDIMFIPDRSITFENVSNSFYCVYGRYISAATQSPRFGGMGILELEVINKFYPVPSKLIKDIKIGINARDPFKVLEGILPDMHYVTYEAPGHIEAMLIDALGHFTSYYGKSCLAPENERTYNQNDDDKKSFNKFVRRHSHGSSKGRKSGK